MFRSVIDSTPFTTDAANSYFTNIVGDSFSRDVTFLSTLRALVAPRIENGDRINLAFSSTSYEVNTVRSNPAHAVIDAICSDVIRREEHGRIQIHNFSSSNQDDNYCCLELIKSDFENRYNGWHRLNKVTDFYRKSFYVLCFINPDIKSVYLFVDNLNVKKMHYLQCSIFAFLPWYFDPEKGVSELEMALINSLRERSAEGYEKCILEISKQYDFRTGKIRALLADLRLDLKKPSVKMSNMKSSHILIKLTTLTVAWGVSESKSRERNPTSWS